MTTYGKSTLKTFFETGDVPTGQNFSDFIDSYVNIVDTGTQSMAGALNVPELQTARVSASNVNLLGTLTVAGITSVANLYGDIVTVSAVNANALTMSGDVSANSNTVYASVVRSTNGFIGSVGIVSAAGTTQGAAASLTNVVNRGKGVADGATTGYTPLTGRPGLIQYLYNEGPSANLWPPTGGTINGLAANAAFALAASAMVTIVHLTASAYAAK